MFISLVHALWTGSVGLSIATYSSRFKGWRHTSHVCIDTRARSFEMLQCTWGIGEPGQSGHCRVCLPILSIPCGDRRLRGPSAFEYEDATFVRTSANTKAATTQRSPFRRPWSSCYRIWPRGGFGVISKYVAVCFYVILINGVVYTHKMSNKKQH
jgi:hypothetical protein